MQEAVIGRYRRIIRRDIDPRLRDKSIYRGIERSITNWERLSRFSARNQFAIQDLKTEIALALGAFLQQEIKDVATGRRTTSVNCDLERLQAFSSRVGFDLNTLPPEWMRHLNLA